MMSPPEAERARRYQETYALPLDDAALLAADPALAELLKRAVAAHDAPEAIANLIIHELLRELKERELADLPVTAEGLAALVRLQDEGRISSAIAKQVFEVMVTEGGDPEAIVETRGLEQVTDEAEIATAVRQVLHDHPDEAARYRDGEERLHGWFVGQVMRATKGKANPELVNELLREMAR